MSVLTGVTVPGDEFLMGRTLERVPDARTEIERVAVEPGDVTPYFWAASDDFEAFKAALADDPMVADDLAFESHDGCRLYRVSWELRTEGIVYAVCDADATIPEATSDDTLATFV
ncbi:bacterio-opsin activator domain-containing protein [Halorussus litoreus]|uniref:bacterio-opsin activator domain-containing protein n=1 Tax=Halorussus litoreus TaxID=1710536 RepID=UPI000E21CD98|nr:hypothetical protein [Halorussus litoreus]